VAGGKGGRKKGQHRARGGKREAVAEDMVCKKRSVRKGTVGDDQDYPGKRRKHALRK